MPSLSDRQRRNFSRTIPYAAVVVGVALFIIGFAITNTGDPDPVAVTSNPAIEELIPAPGAEVLRQSRVGIDLAAGYTAELVINGTPIPLDQLNVLRDEDDPLTSADQASEFDSTLNKFEYQPLEGRVIPELKGDENCVLAEFWPLDDPENRDTVEWCFTVA